VPPLAAVLALVPALVLVTAIHETGHLLAVLAKRGTVLGVQAGHGPVLWSTYVGKARVQVAAIPFGGRLRYDGVPEGTGQAVVAVSGAAANLVAAFLAFTATALIAPAAAPGAAGTAPLAFATASTSAWFWAVPGAVVELVTTGSAVELRRAVTLLLDLVAHQPVAAFPYAVATLSALWAALNLIPIPVVRTDGWHVARSLWHGVRR
jgi:membrane-associated protease RseP (regulator of RpoE activity)